MLRKYYESIGRRHTSAGEVLRQVRCRTRRGYAARGRDALARVYIGASELELELDTRVGELEAASWTRIGELKVGSCALDTLQARAHIRKLQAID
jgi:hypothetical protein